MTLVGLAVLFVEAGAGAEFDAWLLVDEMNRCFQERLVETRAGGGKDRGAQLTPTGETVLAAYRELEAQAARLSESGPYRDLQALLREQPLPTA